MKTKIKALVVLAALLLIGATQINANQSKWRKALLDAEIDAEPALTLEDWMVDESLWFVGNTTLPEETDKPLLLEKWMTDQALW